MSTSTRIRTPRRFSNSVARHLAHWFVDVTAEDSRSQRIGEETHVVRVGARRGAYIATIGSEDAPTDDAYALGFDATAVVSVRVTGLLAAAAEGGEFHVPGGYSEAADFGERLRLEPVTWAHQVAAIINEFEAQAPTLALGVFRTL